MVQVNPALWSFVNFYWPSSGAVGVCWVSGAGCPLSGARLPPVLSACWGGYACRGYSRRCC